MNKYANIIEKAAQYNEKELAKLLKNAQAKLAKGDLDAVAVVDACNNAAVKFAPKKSFSLEVQAKLEDMLAEAGIANPKGNVNGNGVKFSGSVLNDNSLQGKCVAAWYVGFKPAGEKRQAFMEFYIKEKGDAIEAKVGSVNHTKVTTFANLEEAVAAWRDVLAENGAL
jgi:hypothetical protein